MSTDRHEHHRRHFGTIPADGSHPGPSQGLAPGDQRQ
jgi:hypothetical protein